MARLRARLSFADVSSSKVKNGLLTKSDFKASDLPVGLAGPQGAQGSQGLQGLRHRARGLLRRAGPVAAFAI